jgi:TonB family protein
MSPISTAGWLTGTLLAVVCAAPALAQPNATIVPIEWPRPVYPQIAQSARVQGEVEVTVDVRPDGRVAAVEVVRGIPLLDQAVTDAARRARFECRGCVDSVNGYSLYVTFRLQDPPADPATLIISPTQGWVTVVAPSPMIGGGPAVIDGDGRARGVKCLFLWRCDPPPRRARAANCLWLWRCGYMYEWM